MVAARVVVPTGGVFEGDVGDVIGAAADECCLVVVGVGVLGYIITVPAVFLYVHDGEIEGYHVRLNVCLQVAGIVCY